MILKYNTVYSVICLSWTKIVIMSSVKKKKNKLNEQAIKMPLWIEYLTIALIKSIRLAPKYMPTKVTNEVAMDIMGKKKKC